MVAVLRHHRVDHHPVARQSLFDDPGRRRGRRHAAFPAALADALFALGHHHEVFGGLDVQLLAGLVADHRRRLAAGLAGALFRRAGDHAFHTRQFGRQFLPSWMFAALRPCRRQRLALALRTNLQAAHPGLQFQKLQLRGVELLAAGAVLLDPLQP
jgi:hypothetical protein